MGGWAHRHNCLWPGRRPLIFHPAELRQHACWCHYNKHKLRQLLSGLLPWRQTLKICVIFRSISSHPTHAGLRSVGFIVPLQKLTVISCCLFTKLESCSLIILETYCHSLISRDCIVYYYLQARWCHTKGAQWGTPLYLEDTEHVVWDPAVQHFSDRDIQWPSWPTTTQCDPTDCQMPTYH